jgi:hypothetical protein
MLAVVDNHLLSPFLQGTLELDGLTSTVTVHPPSIGRGRWSIERRGQQWPRAHRSDEIEFGELLVLLPKEWWPWCYEQAAAVLERCLADARRQVASVTLEDRGDLPPARYSLQMAERISNEMVDARGRHGGRLRDYPF